MSEQSSWLGDYSPVSYDAVRCDDDGCWCLLNQGKMRLCHCARHNHSGTTQRRTKWDGKFY